MNILALNLPITDPTWIFFIVLIIILFSPMILGKLRIPHIIGMIFAGIIIGEHGFNILERDSSFELFGKVGLYYIMFLAGLEMDLDDFKKNSAKGIVFGLLTFIIPMGLGIWSSMELLGFGVTTSVLLASMYASHTLVAYPIISRYGLSKLRSVNITVGGTAITVALALVVLAVISGMYKGDAGNFFWFLLIGKVVVATLAIVYTFPIIARWFFKKYSDSIMQFVFVLAMVFLGAGLMELAGMEAVLGAFLAGLVLNRLVPHVSPLMNRLEFVGNALFIPYFLIGVGMIIDVNALIQGGTALKQRGLDRQVPMGLEAVFHRERDVLARLRLLGQDVPEPPRRCLHAANPPRADGIDHGRITLPQWSAPLIETVRTAYKDTLMQEAPAPPGRFRSNSALPSCRHERRGAGASEGSESFGDFKPSRWSRTPP